MRNAFQISEYSQLTALNVITFRYAGRQFLVLLQVFDETYSEPFTPAAQQFHSKSAF